MIGLAVGVVARLVAVAGELPEPTRDPDDVRSVAEDVLSDPRYRPPEESPLESFQRWVGERLSELLSNLAGSGGGAVLSWAILLAAVGGLVWVLVRYGRGVRIDPVDGPRAGDTMVELSRSPAAWRAEADELAATGRHREAMRCRHRALVGDLVAIGVIPEIPGRTAREYVADVVVERPDAGPSMALATDLFEGAWYGDAPTGAAELERFVELEGEVLAAARSEARAG